MTVNLVMHSCQKTKISLFAFYLMQLGKHKKNYFLSRITDNAHHKLKNSIFQFNILLLLPKAYEKG